MINDPLYREMMNTEATVHQITEPRLSHDGNAIRFVQTYGSRVRYVRTWGSWLVWTGQRWERDHNRVRVIELARDVSRQLIRESVKKEDRTATLRWADRSNSPGHLNAMLTLARSELVVEHEDLDADPWLLGTGNGVVDLRTGRFRAGRSEDLVTMSTGVRFDPSATCPTWERCLDQWFLGDGELVRYFQRLCGQALAGRVREHLLVIHYGYGANGKSTAMSAIQHVMGDYFCVPHSSLLVVTRHDPHDTEKAALFGKRLAVATETERRRKLNEASVKTLTGGDRLHARRMREDPWEFSPTHTLWLATNHLPSVEGVDHGIWRRLRVVPWKAKFEGATEDVDLDLKLQVEGSGILNWFIEGCLAWQKEGLTEPQAVKRETDAFRSQEDVLGRFAHNEGLVFGDGLQMIYREFAERLKKWCDAEDEGDPPHKNLIADWLGSGGAHKLPKRKRINGEQETIYVGVGFNKASKHATDLGLS